MTMMVELMREMPGIALQATQGVWETDCRQWGKAAFYLVGFVYQDSVYFYIFVMVLHVTLCGRKSFGPALSIRVLGKGAHESQLLKF